MRIAKNTKDIDRAKSCFEIVLIHFCGFALVLLTLVSLIKFVLVEKQLFVFFVYNELVYSSKWCIQSINHDYVVLFTKKTVVNSRV